jgi:hypothetical protein
MQRTWAATVERTQECAPMFETITANSILVWFIWGFFMALGWALGTYVMDLLLGYLPRRGTLRR